MKRRNRTVDHDRRAMQARQTHRRRKALGRALHQVRAMLPRWMELWERYKRAPFRHPRPQKIALPRMVRKHKARLYRELFRA